ncbi:universal stress protein [bacterium]|jgi:nucleotide-binding universal stress UspA family protein|nr:universal stress protein [bacterium]
MMYLRKILVTTDLSEYSLASMEYASSFGILYSSRITLLHVVDHREGHHVRTDGDARTALAQFVEKHISPDISLTPVVRFGDPADEIRLFAQEEGFDLIVMATHGRTGLRHILMGSVVEKVVRHSPVPVLTVKPHPLRESILRNEDIEHELHIR